MVFEKIYEKNIYRNENVILDESDIDMLMAADSVSLDDMINHSPLNLAAIFIDEKAFLYLGKLNEKLSIFSEYEYIWKYVLLNAANCNTIDFEIKVLWSDEKVELINEMVIEELSFIAGKYYKTFNNIKFFEKYVTELYCEFISYGAGNIFEEKLAAMIQKDYLYKKYSNKNSIYIFMGEKLCAGVLDKFAYNYYLSMQKEKKASIIFDMNKDSFGIFTKNEFWQILADSEPEGVLGFQSSYFVNKNDDGLLIGNLFDCPKYYFTFDHPAYICYYLMHPIKNMRLFTIDEDYVEFANKYLSNIERADFWYPAGYKTEACNEKIYDLTFVGKYYDYRDALNNINEYKDNEKQLALKLYNYMIENSDLSFEKAFEWLINNNEELKNRIKSNDDYVVMLHKLKDAGTATKFYYREKIIEEILKAGIVLHVFSESWKSSDLVKYENLIIHSDVSYEEGIEIMSKSYISLNIMSWHKSGMTERVANAMMNGSVCLSDETSYLNENFKNNEEILLFKLKDIEKVPIIIMDMIRDKEKLKKISENGAKKALEKYTWDESFKLFQKNKKN